MNDRQELLEMIECIKKWSCNAAEKTDCAGAYHSTYIDSCGYSSFLFVMDKVIEYINNNGGVI